jgi:hypothetical protein
MNAINLSFQLRKFKKEKQCKPQASRSQEIIKIRTQSDDMENNREN